MQEQIKETELELMEFYHDPTAMTECLIPENINSPQTWPNCECLTLRPYQFAMQNYSYVIADDPVLSNLENLNLKKLSGNLYSIGARNLGKCEYIKNKCQLADGSLKTFEELIGTSQNVISFNDKTLKLEKDVAHYADNGNKPCYKIITYSGKELIVTHNHPLYTENGWVNAENIKESEFLATPRTITINGIDVDDNLAKLLGYMIGDGSCAHPCIDFTNINSEIINDFETVVKYFDCSLTNHGRYGHYIQNAKKNKGKHNYNKIKQLIKQYKIDCLSKNKEIPSELFTWSNKSIGVFLNSLYACDGHVGQDKSGYINVEICLASKKMIYQIQTLLLRFGIHSDIYFKNAKCNNRCFPAWRLNVGHDAPKFLELIGVKSKDKNITFRRTYSTSDRIPNNFILKNYKDFLKKKEFKLRNLKSYNPSRTKCQTISKEIGNIALHKISNSDIYWEQIKSVEYVGVLPTVIVSVDKNHTYISNNVISHNSLFLWIDTVLTIIHKVKEACVASFDDQHLKKVTNTISLFVESHKFLQIFHLTKETSRSQTVKRSPFEIVTQHGSIVKGINEKVESDSPGTAFHGLHFDYLNYEEFSYASDEGAKKRVDSGNSLGYVERLSGIPDLCIGSPMGKVLKDKKNKNWIWRLPQFVRSDYSKEVHEKLAEEHGGEQCFDDKTEVLTNNGWKNINTISIHDKVLSLNPETEVADYYSIKNIFKYNFDGKLNFLKNLKCNFAITDNHRLLYKTWKKNEWRFNSLKDFREKNIEYTNTISKTIETHCLNCNKLLSKRKRQKRFCSHACSNVYYSERNFDKNIAKMYLPVLFTFNGKNISNFHFECDSNNAKVYNINSSDWFEFLGWFISEGSLITTQRTSKNGIIYYSKSISISQSNTANAHKCLEIKNLLARMGVTCYYNKHGQAFLFNSKSIYEHLEKHCYTGEQRKRRKSIYNCYTKCVPDYVKFATPKLINIFLTSFNKGDGDSKRTEYYTSSKQLANDLQELIFKVGHFSNLLHCKHNTNMYHISEGRVQEKGTVIRLDKIQKKDYKGKIWDLEVEPHHNFFIRRNGKCHFTGNSSSFKLNVEAVTLEGAYGFWDMARLKESSFKKNKRIKCFEIGKDNFSDFRNRIHVDKLAGSEQTFIVADMGFNAAPTEIIILFFDGKKYIYSYNITLYRLVREEQAEIFHWLYEQLGGAFIAIDATSDDGETLNYVEKLGVPKSYLLKVKLNENIEVGFQRDDNNEIIFDKFGVPLMQLENSRHFAFQELERLMYGGQMEIPFDEKFLNQFTSTIAKQTKGMKTIYENKSSADHLHSAFEIFAICRFLKEFEIIKGQKQSKRAYCS